MAGEDQDPEVSGPTVAAAAAGVAPEEWRDWAGGLPAEVLEKVAWKVVAQTEAAFLKTLRHLSEAAIQEEMAMRKDGNCLFLLVFARVRRVRSGGWPCSGARTAATVQRRRQVAGARAMPPPGPRSRGRWRWIRRGEDATSASSVTKMVSSEPSGLNAQGRATGMAAAGSHA